MFQTHEDKKQMLENTNVTHTSSFVMKSDEISKMNPANTVQKYNSLSNITNDKVSMDHIRKTSVQSFKIDESTIPQRNSEYQKHQ